MHLFSPTAWNPLNSSRHLVSICLSSKTNASKIKVLRVCPTGIYSHVQKNDSMHNRTNTYRRESAVTTTIVVLTCVSPAASGRTTSISRLATLPLFCSLCWAFHCRSFWRRSHCSSAVSLSLFNALFALYLAYSALRSPLFRPPTPLAAGGVADGTCVIWPMPTGQQSMLQD